MEKFFGFMVGNDIYAPVLSEQKKGRTFRCAPKDVNVVSGYGFYWAVKVPEMVLNLMAEVSAWVSTAANSIPEIVTL